MRALWMVAVICGTAGTACADRLFFLPTGTKLRQSRYRFETIQDLTQRATHREYFSYGVTKSLEAEVVEWKEPGRQSIAAMSLAYSLIDPIPDIVPGFALGLRDITNQTPDGRGLYVAMTYRSNNYGVMNMDTPTEVTLGVGTGTFRGFFVGLMLPFADQLRLIVEHDGRSPTAGFEFRPTPDFGVRLVNRAGHNYFGLTLSRKL